MGEQASGIKLHWPSFRVAEPAGGGQLALWEPSHAELSRLCTFWDVIDDAVLGTYRFGWLDVP